jgi:hypothetical protein
MSASSPSPSPKRQPVTNHDKRRRIVLELVTTEQSYMSTLFQLQQHVIEPLLAQFPDATAPAATLLAPPRAVGVGGISGGAPILTRREFDTIFQGCTLVLVACKEFFSSLSNKFNNAPGWDAHTSTVGDVFARWSHYFKLYKFYCNHFDTASYAFAQAVNNRNRRFADFVDAAVKELGVDVQSVLISPIQRIPRYVLLLKVGWLVVCGWLFA